MDRQNNRCYEFGPFRLDLTQRILLRDGQHVSLTLKAYETLLVLVENRGRILEKEELLNQVWPDTFIEEATLAKNISTLRKALAAGNGTPEYIETIPKRGYRFVVEVKEVHSAVMEEVVVVSADYNREKTETESVAQMAARGSANFGVSTGTPPKKGNFFALTTILVLVMGASFGIYRFGLEKKPTPKPLKAFQAMKVTRLTNSGKAVDAAISPDGRYVVYVVEDTGQQSLWVRQVATTTNIQILAATEARFYGLTFSPDGSHIYYSSSQPNQALPSLYQIPLLGGSPRQLLTEVSSPITFSPDGKLLAFMRREALMIAHADGTGVRELSRHTQHSLDHAIAPYYAPSWSPDGKLVACPDGKVNSSEHYHNLVGVRVEDGSKTSLTQQQWAGLFQARWSADGTGLFMTATDKDSERLQLWHLPYPEGEPQQITNELGNYGGVSLTADANSLVSMQYEQQISLWLLPNSATERATPITFGAGREEDIAGLSWTPDGQIIYVSQASGTGELWSVKPDGVGRKQLTFDAVNKAWPVVTPDGRYVVYIANDKGVLSIWRINIDGTNPKQLANLKLGNFPACSPDGKWVVFSSSADGLWKVPIDGGTPVQLSKNRLARRPAISPDGRLIACRYKERPDAPEQLALFPFEGGEPVKVFAAPPTIDAYSRVLWTPDGKGLAYVNKQGNASNLWVQPLDGASPRQLTHFKSDQVLKFAWSRDGQQLALSRGMVISDVVLLSEIK